MRPLTNKVCGIIAKDIQNEKGLSWEQAKTELKRELTFKNLRLCMQ